MSGTFGLAIVPEVLQKHELDQALIHFRSNFARFQSGTSGQAIMKPHKLKLKLEVVREPYLIH